MKQIENNFAVSGFVGDAEIRQFANASVARSHWQSAAEKTARNQTYLRFHQCGSMAQQRQHRFSVPDHKEHPVYCRGLLKPEEWTDKDGVKHNRIILVANKFYPTPDKEDARQSQRRN